MGSQDFTLILLLSILGAPCVLSCCIVFVKLGTYFCIKKPVIRHMEPIAAADTVAEDPIEPSL